MYHMGLLNLGFGVHGWEENFVENFDENHSTYDFDDRFCQGKKGANFTCRDVLSGGEAVTVVLRLIGGPNLD